MAKVHPAIQTPGGKHEVAFGLTGHFGLRLVPVELGLAESGQRPVMLAENALDLGRQHVQQHPKLGGVCSQLHVVEEVQL